MENYDFKECFREEMSSGEALHAYVKLLMTVPENQREALGVAYDNIADAILRRECEEVKKGWMY